MLGSWLVQVAPDNNEVGHWKMEPGDGFKGAPHPLEMQNSVNAALAR